MADGNVGIDLPRHAYFHVFRFNLDLGQIGFFQKIGQFADQFLIDTLFGHGSFETPPFVPETCLVGVLLS